MKHAKKMILVDYDESQISKKEHWPDKELNIKPKPLILLNQTIENILDSEESVENKLRKYFYALRRLIFYKNNLDQFDRVPHFTDSVASETNKNITNLKMEPKIEKMETAGLSDDYEGTTFFETPVSEHKEDSLDREQEASYNNRDETVLVSNTNTPETFTLVKNKKSKKADYYRSPIELRSKNNQKKQSTPKSTSKNKNKWLSFD